MTLNEAKKDYAARLTAAGVPFTKLTAGTISFEGFGYGRAIFVTVHGADFPVGCGPSSYLDGVPKPSEGGYVPKAGHDCRWGGSKFLCRVE
jgi:hypothetical protein